MYNTLRKLIPGSIKSSVIDLVRAQWEKVEAQMPRLDLEEKHVEHLKAVTSREALLKLLPKNAVVAEIGVASGDFSEMILRETSPAKLHLVDVWSSYSYHDGFRRVVENKFQQQIQQGQIEINLGYSTEVVHSFPDEYFDWIYIDTDHSYPTTRDELALYSKKMKPGGIMAGHDFIVGFWKQMKRYGVIEAVYEFCVKNDWELLYLSLENTNHPSFAIRKIGTAK